METIGEYSAQTSVPAVDEALSHSEVRKLIDAVDTYINAKDAVQSFMIAPVMRQFMPDLARSSWPFLAPTDPVLAFLFEHPKIRSVLARYLDVVAELERLKSFERIKFLLSEAEAEARRRHIASNCKEYWGVTSDRFVHLFVEMMNTK